MRTWSDGRRWATGLAVVGASAGLVAVGFRVAFVTDPLGPRAFPWLAAGLLLASAVGLWRHPGADAEWPDLPARSRLIRVLAGLLIWSVAMPLAGFVPTTAGLMAWLGHLFGARLASGLAAGLVVALGLWALFGYGLGLPLPTGPWG